LRAIAEAVKADNNAYIEEITVNKAAGTVHRIVWIDGEKKRDTGDLKAGAELDHPASDGRPAKVGDTQLNTPFHSSFNFTVMETYPI
jgi:hypothetical protein